MFFASTVVMGNDGPMTNSIVLLVESEVVPGKVDDLQKLIAEVSAHCHATEPGMMRYDWFISPDGSSVRVLEEYADSEAIRFHGQNYASFQPALGECRTVRSLQLLGEPDDELREIMESRGAPIFAPVDSD